MAYPVETPSRIWRRIKEGEARDDDMPSLPSLPGLDDSGIFELEHAPSSPEENDPDADVRPLGKQAAQPQPTSIAPRVDQYSASGNDPTPLPSGMSLFVDISEEVEKPHSASLSLGGLDQAEEVGSLASSAIPVHPPESVQVAYNTSSKSGTIRKLKLPECHPLPVDTSTAHIDGSQKLEVSGKRGSLPGGAYQFYSPGGELRKTYTAGRQAIPSSSLQSMAPPTPSLPSMSSSNLPPWSLDDGHESTSDQKSDPETVHGSSTAGQLGCAYAVERSDLGDVHGTVGTMVPRDPTHPSEDAETTRETFIHFSHANPLQRRKSFLLSVMNSATRPRITIPTPLPRARLQKAVTNATKFAPGPFGLLKTGVKKSRLSHPLSQIAAFTPSTPYGYLPGETEPDDSLEGAASNSFVSTASSHDLTVRHRVNASFDPLTGPLGVGRFNAGKLNTYLHGLNRRLQEENELLVNRIQAQQAELEMLHDHTRHRELSGVIENDAAEQWVVEKESLEQKMLELEQLLETKDKDLASEQVLRMRDNERWKERMVEVEAGVGHLVTDLEGRIQEAETRAATLSDVEQQLRAVRSQLENAKAASQLIKQRTDHPTSDVGEDIKEEMQVLKQQLRGKDDTIVSMQASLADKEREASSLNNVIRDLESSLRIARETIETSHQDGRELRSDQRALKDGLRVAHSTVDGLKLQLPATSERTEEFEKQLCEVQERLSEKQETLDVANERIALSSEELERAKANIRQLESALQESDKKILSYNEELAQLRSKLSIMGREYEKGGSNDLSRVGSLSKGVNVNALQEELADAMKEIGRLTSLLDQNPARRALDKARESRIDLLEKENQELLEQLRAVRDASYYTTPQRKPNMSGLSPMQRRLINLSLKTPRTPGEPLRNASWLMNITGEISTTQLVEEVGRLQRELDLANESIDDKLDKLEEAGLGVVGLTKALEDARRRVVELENELEERETRLPKRYSCLRCVEYEKANPNETLQLRLTAVTAELEFLRKQHSEEMASSWGEKAVLRDTTKRLNIEIKRAKAELKVAERRGHMAEKSKSELQQELVRARKTIDDLDFYLRSERSRLRMMSGENSDAVKEKQKILEKLHETEQRMERARDRIFQIKEDNIKLEAELKVQRKTASIEEALMGNKENIERLRQERSELSDKYYDLQQQLAEASKNASELEIRYARLQMSYDGRRRQLDRQAHEIETLRGALSSQAQILGRAKSNKENNGSECEELRSLACKLEVELKRVQQDAILFGRDLVRLRAERDELVTHHREELEQHERAAKQIRSQLRDLKQQLSHRKENRELTSEIQASAEALRLRHNRECKGLFVQIRYLKARCTREAALRDDLGYQKGYLLVLLSRFQESEKRILATIAQIGSHSTSTTTSRPKSLRKAVLALIFISRARRASVAWREQRSACSAVTLALDNVRKIRALKV